ncbi:hypothetical protein Pelo_15985 [Pelomyxa schiedti]|nr:hypothetical protein Pelo_15985 [Pelomyxa schiedti]
MKMLLERSEGTVLIHGPPGRQLFIDGYKNLIGARRVAWRCASSVEEKEKQRGTSGLRWVRGYRQKIEGEIYSLCHEVVGILDGTLIPSSVSPEEKERRLLPVPCRTPMC